MAYSLPDGTKIDQIIWDNQALYSSSGDYRASDYIPVPALYSGRLKILFLANNDVIIRGQILTLKDDSTYEINPYIMIQYYNKNKSNLRTMGYVSNIAYGSYKKNNIMCEFNIPYRYIINKWNYYNCYYIRIWLYYNKPASSGNISAYLIWE